MGRPREAWSASMYSTAIRRPLQAHPGAWPAVVQLALVAICLGRRKAAVNGFLLQVCSSHSARSGMSGMLYGVVDFVFVGLCMSRRLAALPLGGVHACTHSWMGSPASSSECGPCTGESERLLFVSHLSLSAPSGVELEERMNK